MRADDLPPLLLAWRNLAASYAVAAPGHAARFTRLADQLTGVDATTAFWPPVEIALG
jgi:hypothetical protein